MDRRIWALWLVVVLGACVQILGDDFEIAPSGGAGGGTGGMPTGGSAPGGTGGTAFSASLSADPSSVRILRGASAEIAVTVMRDGLEGDIELVVDGLPTGVTASPTTIADGASDATLTLTVEANAVVGPATLSIGDSLASAMPAEVALMVADPPGTLDESFDSDGLLVVPLPGGTGSELARNVTLTPSGDVIVAASLDANLGWRIVRFDQAGVLDTTFNTNALAAVPTTGRVYGIGYDPVEQKVVACGTSGNTTLQGTVLVLNDNGTADQSFSGDGIAILSSIQFGQGSLCHHLIVQPDSKILIAGYGTSPDPIGIAARFGTDGELDPSFAGDGIYEDAVDTRKTSVMLEVSGAMIVAGREQSGNPVFDAIRLDASGVLDGSYGTGGRGTLGGDPHLAHEAVLEPDGHVFICGESIAFPEGEVGRFSPTGQPALDGTEFAIHNNNDRFYGCAAQADGMLLAAGTGFGAVDQTAYVARMDGTGTLDPTFGDAGVASLYVMDTAVRPDFRDVEVQADGRIVAVGGQATQGMLVVRFWD